MTIASASNDIAVAQGGTASSSGTIAGAIDALNDTLAGSDQESCQTIEGAVRLLGEHIGGGSSITVEALSVTENDVYTAPEGKAYSPVTVNVAGGATEYDIKCYTFENNALEEVSSFVYPTKKVTEKHEDPDTQEDVDTYFYIPDKTGNALNKAEAGTLLSVCYSDLSSINDYVQLYLNADEIEAFITRSLYYPSIPGSGNIGEDGYDLFVMPSHNAAFIDEVD